jgi:hypothetical protein
MGMDYIMEVIISIGAERRRELMECLERKTAQTGLLDAY